MLIADSKCEQNAKALAHKMSQKVCPCGTVQLFLFQISRDCAILLALRKLLNCDSENTQ